MTIQKRKPQRAPSNGKRGQPTVMTESLLTEFFALISEGHSVEAICKMHGMPATRTIYYAIKNDPKIEQLYRNAREVQAERFLDEIIKIADDSSRDTYIDPESGKELTDHEVVARSRLRVDTRKWAMARMSPKKYSDKVIQEHIGKDGGAIQIEQKMTLADFYNECGDDSAESEE